VPDSLWPRKKCDNCKLDFPDIHGGWSAGGDDDVVATMEKMYGCVGDERTCRGTSNTVVRAPGGGGGGGKGDGCDVTGPNLCANRDRTRDLGSGADALSS